MSIFEAMGLPLDSLLRVDPEIDLRSLRAARMHINIAYDGAREGDADCEYILGACCAIDGFARIFVARLKEDAGFDPNIKLREMSDEQLHLLQVFVRPRSSAEYWFTKAAENRGGSVGTKLAIRMLDASTPLEVKKHNLTSFPPYLEDFLYKSAYYSKL